jgi:hypothetical protein
MKNEIDVFPIVLQALTGLCLFLYAVNLMGDTLKELPRFCSLWVC